MYCYYYNLRIFLTKLFWRYSPIFRTFAIENDEYCKV